LVVAVVASDDEFVPPAPPRAPHSEVARLDPPNHVEPPGLPVTPGPPPAPIAMLTTFPGDSVVMLTDLA
jgi:hypothetical protein